MEKKKIKINYSYVKRLLSSCILKRSRYFCRCFEKSIIFLVPLKSQKKI